MRSQTQWVKDPDESQQLREVEVGTGGGWMVDGFMGLFVEWIGRGDGENEMENEMSLISVAVGRNGNGRVVAEYRDAVGERVEVDVPIVRHYPCNDTFGVGGCNGDGLGRCDAVGNGIQQGEFHYGDSMHRMLRGVKEKLQKF